MLEMRGIDAVVVHGHSDWWGLRARVRLKVEWQAPTA
jgi:hypothetical protein